MKGLTAVFRKRLNLFQVQKFDDLSLEKKKSILFAAMYKGVLGEKCLVYISSGLVRRCLTFEGAWVTVELWMRLPPEKFFLVDAGTEFGINKIKAVWWQDGRDFALRIHTGKNQLSKGKEVFFLCNVSSADGQVQWFHNEMASGQQPFPFLFLIICKIHCLPMTLSPLTSGGTQLFLKAL